ncbi:MAG: C40 family peptidase [Peptococcaceae bacterium]|nr:C40 family peptidase [Peptococcaceae bacterium]
MVKWQNSPLVGCVAIGFVLAGSLFVAKPMVKVTPGQLLLRASVPQATLQQFATTPNTNWQSTATIPQVLERKISSKTVVKPKSDVNTSHKKPSAQAIAAQQEVAKIQSKVKVSGASRSINSSEQGLIGFAKSLIGTPYVFGGNTTAGFDCSAFTKYVYARYGVSLPRTSFGQFDVGSAVSMSNLAPGDLVFFTTYQSGPSHVGIYVGGGNFIHASNSGVRVEALSGYYARRFVGARKIR